MGVDEGAAPSLCSTRDWEEEEEEKWGREKGERLAVLGEGDRPLSRGTISKSFSGTDSKRSKQEKRMRNSGYRRSVPSRWGLLPGCADLAP